MIFYYVETVNLPVSASLYLSLPLAALNLSVVLYYFECFFNGYRNDKQ